MDWCSRLTSRLGLWLSRCATGSIPRSAFVFCGGENVRVHTLSMGVDVHTALFAITQLSSITEGFKLCWRTGQKAHLETIFLHNKAYSKTLNWMKVYNAVCTPTPIHRLCTQTFSPPQKTNVLLGIEPVAPPPSQSPSRDVNPLHHPPPHSRFSNLDAVFTEIRIFRVIRLDLPLCYTADLHSSKRLSLQWFTTHLNLSILHSLQICR